MYVIFPTTYGLILMEIIFSRPFNILSHLQMSFNFPQNLWRMEQKLR